MMQVKKFLGDESGAVVVETVAITAAVVGFALAVMAVVATGTEDLSGETQATLAEIDVGASFNVGAPLDPATPAVTQ